MEIPKHGKDYINPYWVDIYNQEAKKPIIQQTLAYHLATDDGLFDIVIDVLNPYPTHTYSELSFGTEDKGTYFPIMDTNKTFHAELLAKNNQFTSILIACQTTPDGTIKLHFALSNSVYHSTLQDSCMQAYPESVGRQAWHFGVPLGGICKKADVLRLIGDHDVDDDGIYSFWGGTPMGEHTQEEDDAVEDFVRKSSIAAHMAIEMAIGEVDPRFKNSCKRSGWTFGDDPWNLGDY